MKRQIPDFDAAWARAAAILSRSHLEAGLEALLRCRTVRELAQTVFPDSSLELPGKLLVPWIQRAMAARCLADLRLVAEGVVAGGDPGSRLVARQLARLESVWTAPPGTVAPADPGFWLDLLVAADACHGEEAVAGLLRRELAARRSAWVLRLRCYFGLGAEQIQGRIGGHFDPASRLALDLPLGNPAAWAGWRFGFLLGPAGGHTEGVKPAWFDLVAYERRMAVWLRMAWWHQFHLHPGSAGAILAFCRLKEAELQLVSSVAEGLLLGLAATDMAQLMGKAS